MCENRLLIEYQLSEFKILLGDHSNLDPPDSMPNSVVKRISADGSVGLPHVRVGHRQALISSSSFKKMKAKTRYLY